MDWCLVSQYTQCHAASESGQPDTINYYNLWSADSMLGTVLGIWGLQLPRSKGDAQDP